MPLADVGGLVAPLGEPVGDGLLVHGQVDVVTPAAGGFGVLSRLQRRARRSADRLTGECVLEARALLGHLVEVGGDGKLLPVAAAGVPPLLVGKEEHEIGRTHSDHPQFVGVMCPCRFPEGLAESSTRVAADRGEALDRELRGPSFFRLPQSPMMCLQPLDDFRAQALDRLDQLGHLSGHDLAHAIVL